MPLAITRALFVNLPFQKEGLKEDCSPCFSQSKAGRSRDSRIDFWRGICLVGMAMWHLVSHHSFPTWFAFPIIQSFNFVAEGFVFLAGAAVGLSRSGRSFFQNVRHYSKRAFSLLLTHYSLALPFGIFLLVYGPTSKILSFDILSERVVEILIFSYQPYLGDVLSLFVFLFALTPLLLWGLGKFKDSIVFLSVLVVFLASNLSYSLLPTHWWKTLDFNQAGAFDVNTWLLVFVCGIFFGKYYSQCLAFGQKHFGRLIVIVVSYFFWSPCIGSPLK